MASNSISLDDEYSVTISTEFEMTLEVGVQGPPGRPGTSGADISPDPDNALEERPNGLYVTSLNPLSSTNW